MKKSDQCSVVSSQITINTGFYEGTKERDLAHSRDLQIFSKRETLLVEPERLSRTHKKKLGRKIQVRVKACKKHSRVK